MHQHVFLIPARGGSKGLPGKNLVALNGRPLIAWTIRAALGAETPAEVFVSTEDAEIATVAAEYGACVIDRPSALASDTATSQDVVTHALGVLRREGMEPEALTLLQPTSPLRDSGQIDAALRLFTSREASMVVSVFRPNLNAAKAYKISQYGQIEGLLFAKAPYSRRQDLPETVFPNGAIYVVRANDFLVNQDFPTENVYAFEMSADQSIDVDTREDLVRIEQLMEGVKYE